MIFRCPCCQRPVFVLKEVGGTKRCPYCDCEVMIRVEKKPLIALLFVLFALPFLFSQQLETLVLGSDNTMLYFSLYYIFLFIIAIIVVYKVSHWEAAKK